MTPPPHCPLFFLALAKRVPHSNSMSIAPLSSYTIMYPPLSNDRQNSAVRPLPGRWTQKKCGPPAPWSVDTPVVRHGHCRNNHHSRAHPHGHRISLYHPTTLCSIPTTLCSTPTTLCIRMGTGLPCTARVVAHCPSLPTGSGIVGNTMCPQCFQGA